MKMKSLFLINNFFFGSGLNLQLRPHYKCDVFSRERGVECATRLEIENDKSDCEAFLCSTLFSVSLDDSQELSPPATYFHIILSFSILDEAEISCLY